MIKSFIVLLIILYSTFVSSAFIQKMNITGRRQNYLRKKHVVCGVNSLEDLYYNCDQVNKTLTSKKPEVVEAESDYEDITTFQSVTPPSLLDILLPPDYDAEPDLENGDATKKEFPVNYVTKGDNQYDLSEYDAILEEGIKNIAEENTGTTKKYGNSVDNDKLKGSHTLHGKEQHLNENNFTDKNVTQDENSPKFDKESNTTKENKTISDVKETETTINNEGKNSTPSQNNVTNEDSTTEKGKINTVTVKDGAWIPFRTRPRIKTEPTKEGDATNVFQDGTASTFIVWEDGPPEKQESQDSKMCSEHSKCRTLYSEPSTTMTSQASKVTRTIIIIFESN